MPHTQIAPEITHAASRIAGRARALIPWARGEWTRWAESLHVYDRRGTPCLHVVLNTSGSQEEALGALLDATGPLQYRHARQHDYGVHGSVLLPDGTVVTASAVSPT